MSPLIKRLCPSCRTALIASPSRRCQACAKVADQARGSRQQRGYGAQHARWRLAVLATYPTCADVGLVRGHPLADWLSLDDLACLLRARKAPR